MGLRKLHPDSRQHSQPAAAVDGTAGDAEGHETDPSGSGQEEDGQEDGGSEAPDIFIDATGDTLQVDAETGELTGAAA